MWRVVARSGQTSLIFSIGLMESGRRRADEIVMLSSEIGEYLT